METPLVIVSHKARKCKRQSGPPFRGSEPASGFRPITHILDFRAQTDETREVAARTYNCP